MKIKIDKIKREMKRLGWNQSELARQAEVSRQWISMVLRYGHKGLTFKTISALAKALDVDPRDLIK